MPLRVINNNIRQHNFILRSLHLALRLPERDSIFPLLCTYNENYSSIRNIVRLNIISILFHNKITRFNFSYFSIPLFRLSSFISLTTRVILDENRYSYSQKNACALKFRRINKEMSENIPNSDE